MSDPFIIPNNHGVFPDSLDLSPDRFISIFEDQSGTQSVFSADRETEEVQLCIVDDTGQWNIESINYDDMDGPFVLNADEQTWLIACWASLLGKPIFEVAKNYLAARLSRTLSVSVGIPAGLHDSLFTTPSRMPLAAGD